MAKRKPIKPWRTTFCVIYHGIGALSRYREPVLAILRNAAYVQGIECAVKCGNGGWLAGRSLLNIDPKELEPDLVHFRSDKRPIISRRKFEEMLLPLMPSILEGVDVSPFYQYELKERPFPDESDLPPLSYGLS